MQYRTLPHGGEKISVVGLGGGSLHNACAREIEEAVNFALDAGMNIVDMIPSTQAPFLPMAKALRPRLSDVHLQVHIGATYADGNYGWTTDAEIAKHEFESRLELLGADCADFGFIHCIDEEADYDAVMEGGIWEYALEMKRQGAIRHLAFSTHSVAMARRFLATGRFDLAMLAVNPMYDYTDESQYGKGETDERMALYRECESAGVGISVMKAFAGGQLLNAQESPFGRALTKAQCVQYALDKPGVLSVLPGVRGLQDVKDLVACVEASEAERDYSELGSLVPRAGKLPCVYCNHCQPCPEGLQIGLINKYYDLARQGDALAADHYRTLGAHAGDCIGCGHCDARCPFGVEQSARMVEIAGYFGM